MIPPSMPVILVVTVPITISPSPFPVISISGNASFHILFMTCPDIMEIGYSPDLKYLCGLQSLHAHIKASSFPHQTAPKKVRF